MNLLRALLAATLVCGTASAGEMVLKQRVTELETRVSVLEQLLEDAGTKDRWKDPIIWSRIKKEMSGGDIKKLLGRPDRIEEQIFISWYYHPTSKLHSYVWFDEGKVLGWEAPN